MKKLFLILLTSLSITVYSQDTTFAESEYINDLVVKDVSGNDVNLSDYNGKVLLIVNVASECGYTSQYEGLQKIFDEYKTSGFEVLAFPCNDFGGQEPGSNEQIKEFCSANFGVEFTLFDKVKIVGVEKVELYKRLISSPTVETGEVKWNFEKFLIGKDGKILNRFRSKVKPESDELRSAITGALKA